MRLLKLIGHRVKRVTQVANYIAQQVKEEADKEVESIRNLYTMFYMHSEFVGSPVNGVRRADTDLKEAYVITLLNP